MTRRKTTVTHTTTTKRRKLEEPVNEVIVKKTRTVRTPVVEIRKAATLAQALTEPETVVVKPRTKAVTRTITRHAG